MKLEWALLILFSFISTYLLEVFRLTRFQRALAELSVPCHYWFYWVLAMIRTIATTQFCCLWEISTLWPCSVQRETHIMTQIMILTHWSWCLSRRVNDTQVNDVPFDIVILKKPALMSESAVYLLMYYCMQTESSPSKATTPRWNFSCLSADTKQIIQLAVKLFLKPLLDTFREHH